MNRAHCWDMAGFVVAASCWAAPADDTATRNDRAERWSASCWGKDVTNIRPAMKAWQRVEEGERAEAGAVGVVAEGFEHRKEVAPRR